MEKGDPTESKNIIDVAVSDLSLLFNQDDKIIQEFTNIVNQRGVNFNVDDISQLLNIYERDKISDFLDALQFLVHSYYHHKQIFEENLSNHKSDKKIVDKITKFLTQINTKSLQGLNIAYELGRSDFLDRTTLARYRDENMLKPITDENDEIIGHLPYVKLVFEFVDEKGESSHVASNLSLRGLNSFIELLKSTQEMTIRSAKLYRDKLGDTVIFEEYGK